MHPHIVEGIITWYYGSSMAYVMVGCKDYFPLKGHSTNRFKTCKKMQNITYEVHPPDGFMDLKN